MQLLLTVLLAAPVAAPLSPTPAPAAIQPQDGAREALEKELTWKLENLAEPCQKAKAFLQRNRVYELILEYDPEHKTARKFLGYKFDRKTKEWVMPRKPRQPKDAKPEAVATANAERVRILGGRRTGAFRHRCQQPMAG